MEVNGQPHAPVTLSPKKTPVLLHKRLDGPQNVYIYTFLHISIGKSQLLDYVTLCEPDFPTRTKDFIVFISSKASSPSLVPTQGPLQSVSETFLSRVKRSDHEADRLYPSSAVAENEWK
jgi:hypothetical protein